MRISLLLDATPPFLLRVLNRRLVALDLALSHAHEALRGLERALKVASRGLSEHVDFNQI